MSFFIGGIPGDVVGGGAVYGPVYDFMTPYVAIREQLISLSDRDACYSGCSLKLTQRQHLR